MRRPIRIGVQIQPQHADYATLRAVWREVEALGVDTVFVWDHFYPLSPPDRMHRPGARLGDADGLHFECMTLLGAIAASTERVEFGALVLSNGYRNPNLTARHGAHPRSDFGWSPYSRDRRRLVATRF